MKITLGTQEFEVDALPYGKLKIAILLMKQWNGDVNEQMLNSVGELFAIVICKSVEEIDAMPITFAEITAAMPIIAQVCGLVMAKEAKAPEAAM